MKQPRTRELFGYWNRLRRGRAAPERTEINPADIRNVLADTFMLDVDTDRRFPFRLSGTRVNALFNAEQKGRSFLELWAPEDAKSIAVMLTTVVDGACAIVAGAGGSPEGHPEAEVELLLLPLRHQGKTHARILGLMAPARHLSWLGLLPIERLALRSMRVVSTEAASAFGASGSFAATRTALPTASRTEVMRRGHLRVFPGGREVSSRP